jgi:hypothetical protein
MTTIPITMPRHVLRARIARQVQLGAPAEQLAELRSAYHAAAIADHIAGALPRLHAQHREALADLLTGGGDRDGGA